MRFSDIYKINKNNLDGNFFRIEQQKTKGRVVKGNTTDLSMFTTNVYSWMNITIDNINKNVSIFDNSTEIFKLIYKEPIDTIYGFHISFLGTGRIDEVILSDRDGDLIYYNDFLSGQKE